MCNTVERSANYFFQRLHQPFRTSFVAFYVPRLEPEKLWPRIVDGKESNIFNLISLVFFVFKIHKHTHIERKRIIKFFLSAINNTMMCRFERRERERKKQRNNNNNKINSCDIKTQDIMSGHTTLYCIVLNWIVCHAYRSAMLIYIS